MLHGNKAPKVLDHGFLAGNGRRPSDRERIKRIQNVNDEET